MPLNADQLKELVAGDAVAIRGTATLEPAGGPGDKIFPPTHAVDEKNKKPGAKYAFENRRIDGQDTTCVLIDSVQSQANRMEEALQALWADRRIVLPVVSVDFSSVAPEVGRVTSLTAPHRIADALLRDSLFNDQLFRLSEIGKSFTDASPRNATALFKICPTGLVFGLWDSTGPRGGLGAKFQRALVSEIIGINAVPGNRTESRIDPAQLVNAAAVLYRKTNEAPLTWTFNEAEAERGKVGNEDNVRLKWGARREGDKWKQGEGKLTTANHSNVPPTIDSSGGGVTIDEARHTVVLSLASLQRLGFTTGAEEARTVLAALGLLAVLAAESRGHDLRSRCLLIPRKGFALKLEAVARNGSTTPVDLDLAGAIALYNEAIGKLPDGIKFDRPAGEALAELRPSPKLADLLRKSRELVATGADVGDG
ncbi:type I-U CRISPR-associated RAMP protein Csb1/Cas7u [Nitrosovibrio sp. Nv17]|uniref:type I-G CRISPR-associated RAMP protein Csb1/Cas7g n=1 Tax=Nitrosovibrio sp. Nv17 TaxID=1855339 RepID=UPI000908D0E0|nr:type I-U CRISPR-associated RAMP protein Csb1/Cas7u [Nitrosovibrio sp. Nv17]SFW33161.1 CRISPR-associated protein Csb1 [Nitrosovibrio sp. Nv17]